MPEIEIRKNATETIRVAPTRYKDNDLLDVRVYYEDATGEKKPSRKGLCLRPETWQELLPMIKDALENGG